MQDLRATLDTPTLNALAQHLSECIFKILRKKVGSHHPNEGRDIIDDVHDIAWKAILEPSSADGRALREAFTPRLLHRLRDVLVRQKNESKNRAKFNSTVHASSDGESLDGTASDSTLDEAERICQQIDVEAALEQIEDSQKRLAFRLYMERKPFKSSKGGSISEALGVTERTARQWVKETKEHLKKYKGDVS